MNRNIEIKARASDFDRQMQLAARMADAGPEVIRQHDTFFLTPRGRLKLRRIPDQDGQLIYYERPDRSGPKECKYFITRTHEPGLVEQILGEVLGVLGVISKTRTLYLVGQTRIHLDEVRGLGRFIELEVVLESEQDPADGERIARRLMDRLSITEKDLVRGAYIDLLHTCRSMSNPECPTPSLEVPSAPRSEGGDP